jgi:hypothetical protein
MKWVRGCEVDVANELLLSTLHHLTLVLTWKAVINIVVIHPISSQQLLLLSFPSRPARLRLVHVPVLVNWATLETIASGWTHW